MIHQFLSTAWTSCSIKSLFLSYLLPPTLFLTHSHIYSPSTSCLKRMANTSKMSWTRKILIVCIIFIQCSCVDSIPQSFDLMDDKDIFTKCLYIFYKGFFNCLPKLGYIIHLYNYCIIMVATRYFKCLVIYRCTYR